MTEQIKTADTAITNPVKNNAMVSYAAKQMGMSEETVAAGLGSLFKVAKDNLSKDNFSVITTAIPDINSYIDQAPKSSTSSLTSMFSKSSPEAKAATSLSYLDSALEKLNIPKEMVPTMLNSVTGYLENNGYGQAAGLLKQGLNFL